MLEDIKFLCFILEVLHSKYRREVTLKEIYYCISKAKVKLSLSVL